MNNDNNRKQDPAEGSRKTVDAELSRQDRRDDAAYETGARKLMGRKGHLPDPTHTGDKGDEPKKPYGLTEPLSDRGDSTRHYDGKDPKR